MSDTTLPVEPVAVGSIPPTETTTKPDQGQDLMAAFDNTPKETAPHPQTTKDLMADLDNSSPIQKNVDATKGMDPAQTRQVVAAAKETGTDPNTANQNLSAIQATKDTPTPTDIYQIQQNYPKTASYLGSNPLVAAANKDNTAYLTQMEQNFQDHSLASAIHRNINGVVQDDDRVEQGLVDTDPWTKDVSGVANSLESALAKVPGTVLRIPAFLLDILSTDETPQVTKNLRNSLMNNPATDFLDHTSALITTDLANEKMGEALLKGNPVHAGMIGAAQLSQFLPTLGLALLTGQPEITVGLMSGTEKDKANESIDTTQANKTNDAILNGLASAVFFHEGAMKLLGGWTSVFGKENAVKLAAASFGQILKSMGTMVVVNNLQGLSTDVIDWANKINPEAWKGYVEKTAERTLSGVFAAGIFEIPGVTEAALQRVLKPQADLKAEAVAQAEQLKPGGKPPVEGEAIEPVKPGEKTAPIAEVKEPQVKIPVMAKAGVSDLLRDDQKATLNKNAYLQAEKVELTNKARAEFPQGQPDVLNHISENHEGETAFFPAEQVQTLYQSMGKEPGPEFEKMGVDPETFKNALDQGGDISIPLSTWISAKAGTPEYQAMADHYKAQPNDRTAAQVEEAKVRHADIEKQMVEATDKAISDRTARAKDLVTEKETKKTFADKFKTSVNRYVKMFKEAKPNEAITDVKADALKAVRKNLMIAHQAAGKNIEDVPMWFARIENDHKIGYYNEDKLGGKTSADEGLMTPLDLIKKLGLKPIVKVPAGIPEKLLKKFNFTSQINAKEIPEGVTGKQWDELQTFNRTVKRYKDNGCPYTINPNAKGAVDAQALGERLFRESKAGTIRKGPIYNDALGKGDTLENARPDADHENILEEIYEGEKYRRRPTLSQPSLGEAEVEPNPEEGTNILGNLKDKLSLWEHIKDKDDVQNNLRDIYKKIAHEPTLWTEKDEAAHQAFMKDPEMAKLVADGIIQENSYGKMQALDKDGNPIIIKVKEDEERNKKNEPLTIEQRNERRKQAFLKLAEHEARAAGSDVSNLQGISGQPDLRAVPGAKDEGGVPKVDAGKGRQGEGRGNGEPKPGHESGQRKPTNFVDPVFNLPVEESVAAYGEPKRPSKADELFPDTFVKPLDKAKDQDMFPDAHGEKGEEKNQQTLFEPSEVKYGDPEQKKQEELFNLQLTGGGLSGFKPTSKTKGGDLDTAADLPGAKNFTTKTKLIKSVPKDIKINKVLTPHDAAVAGLHLAKGANERFDGLLTDDNGKPIALVGGFKGSNANVSVPLSTLTNEAFRVKGATKIWLLHNHPSSTAELSSGDLNMSDLVTKAFSGSSIEPQGILAIASKVGDKPSQFAYRRSGVETEGQTASAQHKKHPFELHNEDVPEHEGKNLIPTTEREITQNEPAQKISSPETAKLVANEVSGGESGILLLNHQNKYQGFVPIGKDEASVLRTGDKMGNLYRAISISNSTGSVIVNAEKMNPGSIKNLAGFLNSAEISVHDVIDNGKSWRQDNGVQLTNKNFYQSGRANFENEARKDMTLSDLKKLPDFQPEMEKRWVEIEEKLDQLRDQFGDFQEEARGVNAYSEEHEALINQYDKLREEQLNIGHWGDVNLNQGGEGSRGRLEMAGHPQGASYNVYLNKASDGSTIHHEDAHMYVWQMHDLAERYDNQNLRDRLDTIYKMLSKASGDKIEKFEDMKEKHHEMFARGWEYRIWEGNVPVPGMKREYDKFTQKLRRVYTSVPYMETYLGFKFTDEMRGFYDRVFATEKELEQARSEMGYDSSKAPELPPELSRPLIKLQDEANSTAVDKTLKPQMKEMTALSKEEMAKHENLALEVAKRQVAEMPEFTAISAIEKEGIDARGEAGKIMAGTGGMESHVGEAFEKTAIENGFKDFYHLAEAITNTPYPSELVEQKVQQEMEKYTPLKDSGELPAVATEAMHNDKTLESIAVENGMLKAFTMNPTRFKEAGAQPAQLKKWQDDARIAKDKAKMIMDGQYWKKAGDPDVYVKQERDAAVKAALAKNEGNIKKAEAFRDQRLINNALAKEADRNKIEIAKIQRDLKDYAKGPGDVKVMPRGFWNQAHDLLERTGLREKDVFSSDDAHQQAMAAQMHGDAISEGKQPDLDKIANETGMVDDGKGGWRRENLNEMVTRLDPENSLWHLTDNVTPEILGGMERGGKSLTLDDLRDINKAVKALAFVGKNLDRRLAGNNANSKQGIAESAHITSESVKNNLGQKYAVENRTPGQESQLPWIQTENAKLDYVQSAFRNKLKAILELPEKMTKDNRILEHFCQYLDLKKEDGEVHRQVFWPMREAANKEVVLHVEKADDFNDAMKEHYGNFENWVKKVTAGVQVKIGGQSRDLTRSELMNMARLAASKDGYQRLMDGFGASDEEIEAAINKIDPKDMDFILDLAKRDEKWFPRLAKNHLEFSGVELEPADLKPLMYRGVQVSDGFYHRIKYDPEKCQAAFTFNNLETIKSQVDAVNTNRGYTNKRMARVFYPPRLDDNVYFESAEEQIHDLAYRGTALDTGRFLKNREFSSTLSDAVGTKDARLPADQLRYLAAPPRNPSTIADRIVNFGRTSTLIKNIGFRAAAGVFKYLTDNVKAIEAVNPVEWATNQARYTYSSKFRQEVQAYVYDKDPAMHTAAQNMNYDIQGFSRQWNDPLAKAKMMVYLPERIADNQVRPLLYYMLHKQAMIEHGDPDMAKNIAGQITDRKLTTGNALYHNEWQRGGEFGKAMAAARTFQFFRFNEFWVNAKIAGLEYDKKNLGKAAWIVASSMASSFIIPGLIHWGTLETMRQGYNSQKDRLGRLANEGVQSFFGSMPVWGTFAKAASEAATSGEKGFNRLKDIHLTPIDDAYISIAKGAYRGAEGLFGHHLNEKELEEFAQGIDAAGRIPDWVEMVMFNFWDDLHGKGFDVRDMTTRKKQ